MDLLVERRDEALGRRLSDKESSRRVVGNEGEDGSTGDGEEVRVVVAVVEAVVSCSDECVKECESVDKVIHRLGISSACRSYLWLGLRVHVGLSSVDSLD